MTHMTVAMDADESNGGISSSGRSEVSKSRGDIGSVVEIERDGDTMSQDDSSGLSSPTRGNAACWMGEDPSSPFDSDLLKLKLRLAAQRQGWTHCVENQDTLSSPLDSALLRRKCAAQRHLSDL
jgi:hypothetical protein